MKLIKNEQTEKNTVKLTIEVDKDAFEAAVQKAYKKNVKKIALPGFRKGKAPRKLIEKYYGEGVFYEDAVNFVCPDAYDFAVKEAGISPVDRPEIDIETIGEGKDLVLTATVTVKPEVKLGKYKGVEVEKTVYETKDEDVDAEIKAAAEKNVRMINVEDRPVKKGDVTVIDFEGFADGVAFEGGKGENHTLEIGSGQFIPGFEDQLVGAKLGEETEVNVTFPEEYHAEELKGKPAVFKVTVKEIKEKEYPELNDEFAKDVSDFDTLDEYKEDIRKNVLEQKQKLADDDVDKQIIDKLVELLEAEIPEAMFENKINDDIKEFSYRLQSQNIDINTYLKYTGMDAKSLREGFRSQAERQVKLRLALEKIAQNENFEATSEDIENEFSKIADMYKMEVEKVKNLISEKDLSKDIIVDKAMKLVKETANIK